MTRMLHVSLALSALLFLTSTGFSAQPSRPDTFATLSNLDFSACVILGKVFSHREVMANLNKIARQGGVLRGIKATRESASEPKATLELSFVRQGSPFGPTRPTWEARFKVFLAAPADAGFMVTGTTPVQEISPRPATP